MRMTPPLSPPQRRLKPWRRTAELVGGRSPTPTTEPALRMSRCQAEKEKLKSLAMVSVSFAAGAELGMAVVVDVAGPLKQIEHRWAV